MAVRDPDRSQRMGRFLMVKIRIQENIISTRMQAESYKASRKGAQTARQRVRENITASGRIDTRRMWKSIAIKGTGKSWWKVYTTVPYAKYQEHGIGPVRPVRAKALRFTPKGSNAVVFAQRTRGFPGAHFFKKATASLTARDFR